MNRQINLGDFETFAHVNPDKEQALKPLEEAAEVFSAWQELDYYREGYEAKLDLVDECADVCQAVANLVNSIGVTDKEWQKAVKRCHDRNEIRGRY